MITEDYCNFEISKLLKEKEFFVDCNASYSKKTGALNLCTHSNNGGFFGSISTPTLQMAMKWLREVYNICIVISCDVCDSFEFYATIYIKGENSWITCVDYEDSGSNDYKQVADSAIEYCLTNLI